MQEGGVSTFGAFTNPIVELDPVRASVGTADPAQFEEPPPPPDETSPEMPAYNNARRPGMTCFDNFVRVDCDRLLMIIGTRTGRRQIEGVEYGLVRELRSNLSFSDPFAPQAIGDGETLVTDSNEVPLWRVASHTFITTALAGNGAMLQGATQQKPAVKNATPEQQGLINSGIAEATKLLDNESCAAFFGGKDKGIQALKDLDPYIDPSMPQSGHPQGEMRENGLAINPHGSSFVTPDDRDYTFALYLPGKFAKYTLTLSGVKARAFALLHEGGHKGERFGPTDDDSLTTPATFNNGFVNNYKIWNACFSDVKPKTARTLPEYPMRVP